MSIPMEMDCKEKVNSASGSVPTPMEMDSEPVDPVEPQTVKSVFDLIHAVGDLIPRVNYNKAQCKRIADRFNTIGEEMESMNMHKESDGPVSDDLFKILQGGQRLLLGYAESAEITSLVMSEGDNRAAFIQFHEDLVCVCNELCFKCLPEVKDSDLQDDAEKDKKEMLERISQLQKSSSSDLNSKKRAQVVSEKTMKVDDFKGKLPSYLAIDRKNDLVIKEKRAGRPWEKVSDRDPPHEDGWVIVHEGTWLLCDFAIKVFKCGANSGAREWNEGELLKEVQSLMALQHPHVLRLVGYGHDEESCFFVMELMDGDLKHFMKKNKGGFEKRDVINQVAKGMYYMHERGYTHGDLKCTNIMAKKLDKRVVQVKIGDLRGSQLLEKWDPEASEAVRKIRPRWTAPEAIANDGGKEPPTAEQLKQSDVYSFGMTCYEIVTGKLPYQDIFPKDGLLDYIRDGRVEEFNELPDDLDKDLKGMIRRCWSKEPSERPTFAEICQLLMIGRNRVCTSVLSNLRFFQLLCSWGSNTSSVNSGSLGTYPHVAKIPHKHLKRSSTVKGRGSAGEVFKATWLNCTVAVKKLKYYYPNAQQFPCEVQYLIEVSHHPCTVQLIGLSENPPGEYEIVMEYVKMNLQELIDQKKAAGAKRGPFDFEKALLIITKLALGMVYLHSRGLVHRDLKPNNVLVRDYNERSIDVMIADFGESHLEGNAGSFFDGVGTGFFRAPEVFPFVTGLDRSKSPNEPAKGMVLKSEEAKRNSLKSEEANTVKAEFKKAKLQNKPAERATEEVELLNDSARLIIEKLSDKADLDAMKATDVYSFGMVCYKVLTGEDPFDGLITDYFKVWNGLASLEWPSHSHPDLRLLVERCVRLDPKERPTFEQICQELHENCRRLHNTSEPEPL